MKVLILLAILSKNGCKILVPAPNSGVWLAGGTEWQPCLLPDGTLLIGLIRSLQVSYFGLSKWALSFWHQPWGQDLSTRPGPFLLRLGYGKVKFSLERFFKIIFFVNTLQVYWKGKDKTWVKGITKEKEIIRVDYNCSIFIQNMHTYKKQREFIVKFTTLSF